MQPSSLIFLVILGVWAAFFLQYWMRRREMIATARSIDTFTETMRVLQVSEPADLDIVGPSAHASSSSPGHALRAQVLVKRAQTPTAATADRDGGYVPRLDEGMPSGSESEYTMSPARSLRGLTLLIGLAGLLVYLVLVLAGAVRPLALLAPIAVAAGGFLWLRSGVQAEIAQRRAARASRAQAAQAAPASWVAHVTGFADAPEDVGRAHGPSRPVDARTEHVDPGTGVVAEDVDGQHAMARTRAATGMTEGAGAVEEVFDGRGASAPGRGTRAAAEDGSSRPALGLVPPLLDEDDMPLTWEPRRVPPPLYTQKARVERRPVASDAGTGEGDAGEHAAFEVGAERRIVNG